MYHDGWLAFNNFSGIGKGGTGTLKVDGTVVATKRMEKTIPIILQWDESFDIGSDTITGINHADYKPPFAESKFTTRERVAGRFLGTIFSECGICKPTPNNNQPNHQ